MSEHRMGWLHKRAPSTEPAPPTPKDSRAWDPDEDPTAKPTDGGNPAASKNKRRPLGEGPIGI